MYLKLSNNIAVVTSLLFILYNLSISNTILNSQYFEDYVYNFSMQIYCDSYDFCYNNRFNISLIHESNIREYQSDAVLSQFKHGII